MKHTDAFRIALDLLEFRKGIHALADIVDSLDTGLTLVFRNPDGTEREAKISQINQDESAVSICDCHSVDVVPVVPTNREDFRKWYEAWSKTPQCHHCNLPSDFRPSDCQIEKLWHVIHDPISPSPNPSHG